MRLRSPVGPVPAEPLSRFEELTPEAIASGDPDRIKQLYVTLGDDWWTAHGECRDIPVLSLPETLPAVVSCLKDVTGMVLDAGCGPNPAASIGLAVLPGVHVVSMDLGLGTVRVAKALASRQGAGILGVVGDVERLPFRTGAFDGLVCDDTIEHLPNVGTGLRELARVLKRSGTGVLATPNRHNAVILRERLRDRLHRRHRRREDYYLAESHLYEYTWSEFERLIAPIFSIKRRILVGWSGATRRARLTPLLRLLPRGERLGQMIVAEVERC